MNEYLVKFYSHRMELKIGVVIKVLCYKPLMIVPKITLMNLRDTLRHELSNHCISSKVLDPEPTPKNNAEPKK
jgi:hypothetical protein